MGNFFDVPPSDNSPCADPSDKIMDQNACEIGVKYLPHNLPAVQASPIGLSGCSININAYAEGNADVRDNNKSHWNLGPTNLDGERWTQVCHVPSSQRFVWEASNPDKVSYIDRTDLYRYALPPNSCTMCGPSAPNWCSASNLVEQESYEIDAFPLAPEPFSCPLACDKGLIPPASPICKTPTPTPAPCPAPCPAPTPSPSPSSGSSSNVWILILILAIVLALLMGGWYCYKRKKTGDNKEIISSRKSF